MASGCCAPTSLKQTLCFTVMWQFWSGRCSHGLFAVVAELSERMCGTGDVPTQSHQACLCPRVSISLFHIEGCAVQGAEMDASLRKQTLTPFINVNNCQKFARPKSPASGCKSWAIAIASLKLHKHNQTVCPCGNGIIHACLVKQGTAPERTSRSSAGLLVWYAQVVESTAWPRLELTCKDCRDSSDSPLWHNCWLFIASFSMPVGLHSRHAGLGLLVNAQSTQLTVCSSEGLCITSEPEQSTKSRVDALERPSMVLSTP